MSNSVIHVLESVLEAAEVELRDAAAKPDSSDKFRIGHIHGLVATANAIVKNAQVSASTRGAAAQTAASAALLGIGVGRPINGWSENTAVLVNLLHDAAGLVAEVEDFSDHGALEVLARQFEELSADASRLAAKVRFDHRAQRQANGKAKEKRA